MPPRSVHLPISHTTGKSGPQRPTSVTHQAHTNISSQQNVFALFAFFALWVAFCRKTRGFRTNRECKKSAKALSGECKHPELRRSFRASQIMHTRSGILLPWFIRLYKGWCFALCFFLISPSQNAKRYANTHVQTHTQHTQTLILQDCLGLTQPLNSQDRPGLSLSSPFPHGAFVAAYRHDRRHTEAWVKTPRICMTSI